MMPSTLLVLLACEVSVPYGKEDTPPLIEQIVVSPEEPHAQDWLSVMLEYRADGRAEVSYEWRVDGALVGADEPELELDGEFIKGAVIELTVTVRDDAGQSSETSGPITIVNTPPYAPNVSLSPYRAFDEDDLSCELGDPAFDWDGDPVEYTMTWQVDGQDHLAGDTIPSADTQPGQTWSCTVVANDGEADSLPTTRSVTVEP